MKEPTFFLPTVGCAYRNGVYHGDDVPSNDIGEPMDAYLNEREMLMYVRGTSRWLGPANMSDPKSCEDLLKVVEETLTSGR